MLNFKYKKLLLYFLIFIGLSSLILYFNFNKKYLIFNLGLSFIPYILTSYCANNKDRVLICSILTIIAILFYPNAIYMFTDLTHIKTSEYYTVINRVVNYNMDYLVWVKLSLEVAMITLSMVLSYESFINILKIVNCYKHKFASFIILVFFSGITGIALYLGRFLRFNSWDVLSFGKIIHHIIFELSINDYLLILIFAAFHFIITIIFAVLRSE